MTKVLRINDYLQSHLGENGLEAVCAIEAARWLDKKGILSDRRDRPGKPLRDLLREGHIEGQERRPKDSRNRIWWINRIDPCQGGVGLPTPP